MDRVVAEAAKRGWTRSEWRGGFSARPDAFSLATLPAASAKAEPARPTRKK